MPLAVKVPISDIVCVIPQNFATCFANLLLAFSDRLAPTFLVNEAVIASVSSLLQAVFASSVSHSPVSIDRVAACMASSVAHFIPDLATSSTIVFVRPSMISFSANCAHSFKKALPTHSAPSFKISFIANLPTVLSPTPAAVLAPIHAGAAAPPVRNVAAAKPTSIHAH